MHAPAQARPRQQIDTAQSSPHKVPYYNHAATLYAHTAPASLQVATVDDESSEAYTIELNSYGQSAVMTLHRLLVEEGRAGQPKCRSPINVITPQVDAGMVYGSSEAYLKVCSGSTLRAAALHNTC